jgi:hypothetical protein
MWDPGRLTTLWVSTACYRDSFTLPYLFKMRQKRENEITRFKSSSGVTREEKYDIREGLEKTVNVVMVVVVAMLIIRICCCNVSSKAEEET